MIDYVILFDDDKFRDKILEVTLDILDRHSFWFSHSNLLKSIKALGRDVSLDDFSYDLLADLAKAMKESSDLTGSRGCQDWSGKQHLLASTLFSSKERMVMARISEQHNSNMQDYDPSYDGLDDEMVMSSALMSMYIVLRAYKNAIKKREETGSFEKNSSTLTGF
jgi:hypothetical protein